MSLSATRSKSAAGAEVHGRPAGHWMTWLRTWLRAARSRLTPADPVLLLKADGSEVVLRGNVEVKDSAAKAKPKFVAVQLPEDMLLRLELPLPRLSRAHSDEAVLLEVQGNSPFAADDLAWGYAIRDVDARQRRADIVIASRRQVNSFIDQRWPNLSERGTRPEAWALAPASVPIVIKGFGEQQRYAHIALQERWDWVLLFLAFVLASFAAMTPTLQLRLRAIEAVDKFEATVKRVGPLVRKRDEIALLNDQLRALDTVVGDRVDPAGVLATLTQILPDDTYLYSLDVQKAKITAAGHTPDASALLQKLSSDPRLKDVRAPVAVTHVPGATKEAFTVEFTLDAKPTPIISQATSVPGSAAPSQAALLPAPGLGTPGNITLPNRAASAPTAVTPPLLVLTQPSSAPASAASSMPAATTLKPGGSPFVVGGSAR
jgi:general secretion pathway protein L